MQARIPATIITGFLGAGKTTLIRHLLTHAGGKRIALIINEFGDLGVDGGILAECTDAVCRKEDLIELANGCICCTVADDFLPAMQALIDRPDPPDHIVIETSGLALPEPLVRAFAWPEIRTRVAVDGVVTVVDGPAVAGGHLAADLEALEAQRAADDALDHTTPIAELFADQLAAADIVVLGKADLLQAPEPIMARLSSQVRPGVHVLSAAKGAVDPAALLGLGPEETRRPDHDHDHHHHHDHDHDDFVTEVVELPEADSVATVETRVSAAMTHPGVLRIKGFASVSGKPMRLVVQAVGQRVDTGFDRGTRPAGIRLVVIALAGSDLEGVRRVLAGPAVAVA